MDGSYFMRQLIFLFDMPTIHTGTCGTEITKHLEHIRDTLRTPRGELHSFRIRIRMKRLAEGEFPRMLSLSLSFFFMFHHKVLTNLNEEKGACIKKQNGITCRVGTAICKTYDWCYFFFFFLNDSCLCIGNLMILCCY